MTEYDPDAMVTLGEAMEAIDKLSAVAEERFAAMRRDMLMAMVFAFIGGLAAGFGFAYLIK